MNFDKYEKIQVGDDCIAEAVGVLQRWVLAAKNDDADESGTEAFYASYKKQNDFYDAGYAAAERLEKEGKAFVIYPPAHIHVGRIEKDRKALEALYQAGRDAGEAKFAALLEFVKGSHE